MVKTLQKGDAELGQYGLRAFVVMANPVHILIEPRCAVARIVKGIKGVIAHQANRILDRTGKTFWQDESFDRWARDDAEEVRIQNYIERNPVKEIGRAHV